MHVARVIAALLTAALFAGCGGGGEEEDEAAPPPSLSISVTPAPAEPEQDAEDFFEDLFGFYFKGQYGRAWELLHPGHQAVVPRSKFDECVGERLEGVPLDLKDVEVVEEYEEPIDVPRVPEKTSKAVTLKLTVTNAAGVEESDTDTYHLVDVDGRWAWVLESADVEAYERGECPE